MSIITVAEFTRLKKLMSMTFSESDGEALNALRAANKILKDKNVSWSHFFERTVSLQVESASTVYTESEKKDRSARQEQIDKMFDSVRVEGAWNNFIDSLYHQWQTKDYLSPLQYTALEKAYERL